MTVKFRKDWRKIIRHAYSVRFIVLAFLFSGLEAGLPLMDGFISIPRGLFALLSGLSVAGSFLFKLIAQKQFEEK